MFVCEAEGEEEEGAGGGGGRMDVVGVLLTTGDWKVTEPPGVF